MEIEYKKPKKVRELTFHELEIGDVFRMPHFSTGKIAMKTIAGGRGDVCVYLDSGSWDSPHPNEVVVRVQGAFVTECEP